jgi:ABC-type nitrate/sulfonate/bicarbonate transport system substrate-binding protein
LGSRYRPENHTHCSAEGDTSLRVFFSAFCAAAEQVMIATPSQGLYELPVVVAMRNGYFRTEGLEVQKIQIQPEIAVKALLAGEVDYVSDWGASVQAAMTGAPIKVVAAMVSRPIHVLISRPEIRVGRDLKGKTVGVDSFGSRIDYLSRVAARYLGLDPDRDVKIIDTGGSLLRVAALKDGSIDATAVDVALAVKAEREGLKRLLHLGDIIDLPASGIAVKSAKLATHGEQIKKVIQATLRNGPRPSASSRVISGSRSLRRPKLMTLQFVSLPTMALFPREQSHWMCGEPKRSCNSPRNPP